LQRTIFTQKKLHQKTLTQKNCPNRLRKKKYTPKRVDAKILPGTSFTHKKKSAQKPLGTETSMHSRYDTDAFTHRCLYTEKLLHKLVHTARFYAQPVFYTEKLCFPFLTTYLFVFPLQAFWYTGLFVYSKYSETPFKHMWSTPTATHQLANIQNLAETFLEWGFQWD
jgi:hypothetical protein